MNWEERKKAYLGGTELPPIVEFLQITVISASQGRARLSMQARPQLANAMGTLHGGILCDLGDAAMGYALATALNEGESFATLELKINFFRPIRKELLYADATVVNRSRTIGYVECNIVDESQALVARLGCSCQIVASKT